MQVDKGNVAPGTDALGRTWEEGWQQYAANHPEVLANWGYSHGRWCNCTCVHCDPAGILDHSLTGDPVLVTPPDRACPECGWSIDRHTGWGGPSGCTLTDNGVAQRLHALAEARAGLEGHAKPAQFDLDDTEGGDLPVDVFAPRER